MNFKKIAVLLENSFWSGNDRTNKNVIIGMRLRNQLDHPYVNFEYPYQLVFNFYSPGASYYADQTQLMGGIDINGGVSYQYGWKGKLLDENTIYWENNGSIWTRVKPVANKYNNQYSAESVYNKEVGMTNYLSDVYNREYKVNPTIQGL
jgi:hypothetical protein